MKKLRGFVGSCVLLNAQWLIPTADAQITSVQVDTTNSQYAVEQDALLLDEPTSFAMENEKLTPKKLSKAPDVRISTYDVNAPTENAIEIVVQRYPNGKPQIERHVKLDSEGNYVNHGEYQEWNEAGDLIVTGAYANGLQDGPWIRFCTTRDSDLFAREPYNKFKPPFQSTVEFVLGKLDGLWTISDKDGKTVSQIQLREGHRNGTAVWYHATGVPLWQCEYRNGILDGSFIEKDQSGKVLREIRYYAGRKLEKKQDFHANKKLKSEFEQIGSAQTLKTPDDWNHSKLATYELSGDSIKNGVHATFFDNGSARSTAYYRNGQLDGRFESWYANGQKEVSGQYEIGVQEGQWDWWHPNGMKKASVNYVNGIAHGEPLTWNESGRRVQAELPVAIIAKQPAPPPESDISTTPKRPGTPQRSINSSSRRAPTH